MPFFNERERAAWEWTVSVTRVADTRVPDDVWERVQPHFTPAELVVNGYQEALFSGCEDAVLVFGL